MLRLLSRTDFWYLCWREAPPVSTATLQICSGSPCKGIVIGAAKSACLEIVHITSKLQLRPYSSRNCTYGHFTDNITYIEVFAFILQFFTNYLARHFSLSDSFLSRSLAKKSCLGLYIVDIVELISQDYGDFYAVLLSKSLRRLVL